MAAVKNHWARDPARRAEVVAKIHASEAFRDSVARSRRGGKKGVDGRIHVYHDGRYQPRARVVMEKHVGRKLLPTEHVHHVNGDVADDRIENLRLMTREEHARLHVKQNFSGPVVCEPGCTCGRHAGRKRYWSAGRKCAPGCQCGRHKRS